MRGGEGGVQSALQAQREGMVSVWGEGATVWCSQLFKQRVRKRRDGGTVGGGGGIGKDREGGLG